MNLPETPSVAAGRNEAVSIEQRRARALTWINSLAGLRDCLSGDLAQKADDTIEFINQNVRLIEPIVSPDGESWGISRPEDFDSKSQIGILPFFLGDAALHPFFSQQIDNVTYFEAPQAIFLPPRRTTPLWRGLLLYHETQHGIFHLQGAFLGQENAFVAEEHAIYLDEIAMVRQLYGKPYEKAVKPVAERFAAVLDDGEPVNDDAVTPRGEVLDEVMGRPASNFERGIRRSLSEIDVAYSAFEMSGRDEHLEYLNYLYGDYARDGAEPTKE